VGFSPGSTGVKSCRRKLEGEFLQRVVLLEICVSYLYKEWLFMNRREALMAAAGSIAAAVVAIPSVANAQTTETEDDNPELAPIRALLDAYDLAFTNHDLAGVMATMSEKATMMGCGPGEIWSGPDELKAAHEHLFERFDIGEQNFEYEFSIGELGSDRGWLMTSGNVSGQKDGEDFTFPINISLSVTKDSGKWLIAAMHFSTLTGEVQDDE
jgi:ketosteroid isomerase-like protein